ncbi:hypothetical protein ACIGXI_08055 [Kitasatospora aureofaciens]|uniref:hypothetical protein n=1 Tax=Kitasatospora aureofaciens TaxID=1894 RepID=UPI0037C5D176
MAAAFATMTVVGLVVVCIVALVVGLIGFIVWLTVRKARPSEIPGILSELPSVIQAAGAVLPHIRVTGPAGLTMESEHNPAASATNKDGTLLRAQCADGGTYEVTEGQQ